MQLYNTYPVRHQLFGPTCKFFVKLVIARRQCDNVVYACVFAHYALIKSRYDTQE